MCAFGPGPLAGLVGPNRPTKGRSAARNLFRMPVVIRSDHPMPVDCGGVEDAVLSVLQMEEADTAEVSVLLTDDDVVRGLNAHYRGKDAPTDVLSFSQRESVADAPEAPDVADAHDLLGDVVISVDTVARQAAARNVSLDAELRELAAHGTLHLLGYDDSTPEGAENMICRAQAALRGTYPRLHAHEE